MMRSPRSARRRGLSLIEVLIALTIFLFAFVAIARLVDLSSDEAVEIQWQTDATRLAQSKLAEVSVGAIPLQSTGEASFDEEPDWRWSLEVGNASVPNLYLATVRVYRQPPKGNRFEVAMTQMLLDPNRKGGPGGPPLPAEETEATTGTTGTTDSGTTGTQSSTPMGNSSSSTPMR